MSTDRGSRTVAALSARPGLVRGLAALVMLVVSANLLQGGDRLFGALWLVLGLVNLARAVQAHRAGRRPPA